MKIFYIKEFSWRKEKVVFILFIYLFYFMYFILFIVSVKHLSIDTCLSYLDCLMQF